MNIGREKDESKSSNQQSAEGDGEGANAENHEGLTVSTSSNMPIVATESDSSGDGLIIDEGPKGGHHPSSTSRDKKTLKKVNAAKRVTDQKKIRGSNILDFPIDLSVTAKFYENPTNALTGNGVQVSPTYLNSLTGELPTESRSGKPGKEKVNDKINAGMGSSSGTVPKREIQVVPLDLTTTSTPASTNSSVAAQRNPTSTPCAVIKANPQIGWKIPQVGHAVPNPVTKTSSANEDNSSLLGFLEKHRFGGSFAVDGPPKTGWTTAHKRAYLKLRKQSGIGSGESVLAIKRKETVVTVTTTTPTKGRGYQKAADRKNAAPKAPRGRPRKGTKGSVAAARPNATIVFDGGPYPRQPNPQLPIRFHREVEPTVPLYPFSNFNGMRRQPELQRSSTEGYQFGGIPMMWRPSDPALAYQNLTHSHVRMPGIAPMGYPAAEQQQEFPPWQHQHFIPPWYNSWDHFNNIHGGMHSPPDPFDMYPLGRNPAMAQSARNALHNLASPRFPTMAPINYPNNMRNFHSENFQVEPARNENGNIPMPFFPNEIFVEEQPGYQAPVEYHEFNPGPMLQNVRARVSPPLEAFGNQNEHMRFPEIHGYGTCQHTQNNNRNNWRVITLTNEDLSASAAAENMHFHQGAAHNQATGSQWLTAPTNFGAYGEGVAQRGHHASPLCLYASSAGPSSSAGSSTATCPATSTSGSFPDLTRPSRVKRSRVADTQECASNVQRNSQTENDVSYEVTIHRVRRSSNAFADPRFLSDAIQGIMETSVPAAIVDEALSAMSASTRALVENVVQMALEADERGDGSINRAHLTEVIKNIYFSSFAHDSPN